MHHLKTLSIEPKHVIATNVTRLLSEKQGKAIQVPTSEMTQRVAITTASNGPKHQMKFLKVTM